MSSLLLYNLYPRTIWKEVTTSLLSNVPHDKIVVHVSLPLTKIFQYYSIRKQVLKYDKVSEIYVSLNNKSAGEAKGFNLLRRNIDFTKYDIVTYMHSKGTSRKRKNNIPIKDWTEYMRHFIIDRFDLCLDAFAKGYNLYGVNISDHVYARQEHKKLFPHCKFIYQGNFVSVNLKNIRQEFLNTPCVHHYYSLERFWGTLCPIEKAYCAFQTNVDLYNTPFPPSCYREK